MPALGIWLLDQVPTVFTVIGAVIGGYTLVDARAVEDVNGWTFFAMSYTRADAANVATLRSTSILLGLALVPRTVTRPLVAGAVVTVVGVVLVTR